MADYSEGIDSWKYFLRQFMICSGAWNCYFMLGLCMGAPTVFIPQIRKEPNSTIVISEDMASWLPAVFTYSGLPWIFILSALISIIGRKIPHMMVCVSTFAGFLTFLLSTTVTHVLISEILQGVLTASYLTISIIIITEHAASKYRGLFLTMKSACFFWGILASNVIGTFFHWKKIAMLGLACSAYNLVTVFFWPESPIWLAQKGRFAECTKSHRWLKGDDEESEKELQRLINTHNDPKIKINSRKSLKGHVNHFFKTTKDISFYKPVLFCVLLTLLYMFSGKLVCTVYAIDIIKKMTNSESTAYTGMLILDAVTVCSMYVGSVLSRFLKRRSMLLVSSSISIFFLLSVALYLYLAKLSIISENKYISISLLIGFSISIACGPMLMSTSISAELIPIDNRGIALCIIALAFKITYSVFIKLSPYCFKALGLHGTFLFFGVSSAICLVVIYIYLPETKDKTLQEIADCIKGVSSGTTDEGKKLIAVKQDAVILKAL